MANGLVDDWSIGVSLAPKGAGSGCCSSVYDSYSIYDAYTIAIGVDKKDVALCAFRCNA
jgi:hypothetical protein